MTLQAMSLFALIETLPLYATIANGKFYNAIYLHRIYYLLDLINLFRVHSTNVAH